MAHRYEDRHMYIPDAPGWEKIAKSYNENAYSDNQYKVITFPLHMLPDTFMPINQNVVELTNPYTDEKVSTIVRPRKLGWATRDQPLLIEDRVTSCISNIIAAIEDDIAQIKEKETKEFTFRIGLLGFCSYKCWTCSQIQPPRFLDWYSAMYAKRIFFKKDTE